jgi:WhiB family transcriptional regulator, redox-sensing transcriptional regulator
VTRHANMMRHLGVPTGHSDLGISTPTPVRWQEQAECRKHDPELWFADTMSHADEQARGEARAVCASCPVAALCFDEAEQRGEQYGVWGGVDFGYRNRNSDLLAVVNRAAGLGHRPLEELLEDVDRRAPLPAGHLLAFLNHRPDYKAARNRFGIAVSLLRAINARNPHHRTDTLETAS